MPSVGAQCNHTSLWQARGNEVCTRVETFRRDKHVASAAKHLGPVYYTFLACCLLGLLFHSEDGGSTLLRNVGKLQSDYTCHILGDNYLQNVFVFLLFKVLWSLYIPPAVTH